MTNEELLSALGVNNDDIKEKIINKAAQIVAEEILHRMELPEKTKRQIDGSDINLIYGCPVEPFPTNEMLNKLMNDNGTRSIC